MDFLLQRYSNVAANGGSTQGLFFEKTQGGLLFHSHSIEDEGRKVKVIGETRFWQGLYELKILKLDNDWTQRHRARYGSWFKFPIEITGVRDFAGLLIHTGVDQKDTEGCLCLCDTMGNNTIDPANQGARSLDAVKRFYEKCYPFLEGGGRAWLEARDETTLTKV
jgi:hypothetical protein